MQHPHFNHNAVEMDRLSPLLFFSICAVCDFVLGWIKWHSVAAGIGAIVGGLPLNLVLYFVFRASWKRKGDAPPS